MVTLPSEAAHDVSLVRGLIDGGMDIARINCAHDDAKTWITMAKKVRAAAKTRRRTCRVAHSTGFRSPWVAYFIYPEVRLSDPM